MSSAVNVVWPAGISSPVLTNVMNIINVVVITFIPIFIFAFLDKESYKGLFEKVPARSWIKYLIFIPLIWCTTTYLNSRFNILLGEFGITMIEQLPPSKEQGAIATGFILTCVAAPLFEELFYRGVILSLLKGYGNGAAVSVSALLFALAHGSVTVFVLPLVFGLILGYITLKSKSIFPAMFIHFGCNLLSWIFMTFEIGAKINIAIGLLTIIIGAGCVVWALVKSVKNKRLIGKVMVQTWGYIKNPLWLIILLNYIYTNILYHG